jgi:uncharacterized GH25 family protein
VRGCVLSGKVVDIATDKPVARMNMDLDDSRSEVEWSEDSVRIVADERGEFRAVVAPEKHVSITPDDSRNGDYLIDQDWRREDMYESDQVSFNETITEDRTGLVFKVKLEPVCLLAGLVVDANGTGIAAASVYADRRVPAAKSDTAGAFTLKTAPRDRDFQLFASAKDGKLAGITNVKAGSTSATIRLEPTRDYAGEVTSADGLPAPNLKFYMSQKLNGGEIYRELGEPKTDAQGRFTATNLCPKATYSVRWDAGNEENRDYDNSNVDVDLSKIKEGDPIRFNAKLFLNALMGRVVNEKKEPITNAIVDVSRSDLVPGNEPSRGVVRTDEQGSFSIGRLAAGTITARVSARGYKTRTFKLPTDTVDCEFALTPRSGEDTVYRVTVKDAAGQPVANVPLHFLTVTYSKDPTRTTAMSGFPYTTTTNLTTRTTDSDGHARFTVNPGNEDDRRKTLLVECDAPGYDRAFRQEVIDEDMDIDFVLAKSGKAWCGRVVDAKGQPVSNAEIMVYGLQTQGEDAPDAYVRFEDGTPLVFRCDNVTKNGHWSLCLPEGDFLLTYYAEDTSYQPLARLITVSTNEPLTNIVIELKQTAPNCP